MFFNFNEKTLKDLIDAQNQRTQEAAEKAKANPELEYDGHKIKILQGRDGSVIVDAEPSLIKEVEGDKNAPHGSVDVMTATGWVPKQ